MEQSKSSVEGPGRPDSIAVCQSGARARSRMGARMSAWACRMEGREAGRACGQGRLVSGIGSFSGAGFLEEVAVHY